ncbi:MAG TPA: aminotriazole resistance protein [Candidatus Eisenbergiella merdipullorum]|uniref:Aminotriazole resistance protein n=1 Tax=Candidatus Eisenbergiella merdipullorum TaxID=2838553 RepID=A0A9D2KZB5_9FIRM|nr:aminotriazole resistance protein [Candidatus Eisenbergiella merdipullorum]
MKKKFSFVNIIFFVVFGVLTGVLWAYLCPIPLIPGAVHFRTFAFIIVVIGYLFGPVTGFFSGYIGTIVWALLSGNFIPLHSPLTDGITVGLSAALPALCHLRGRDLMDVINAGKGRFIAQSLFWSLLFGVLMILTTSLSLSYFAGLAYSYCVIWIGIADVVPIALTPFVVLLLAKRMKNIRNIVPYI